LSIFVCRATFFDYGDPGARRKLSHGCWEIDVLVIHYESENAAASAAAKTMKGLPTRAHHERRCFLLMKRAESLEIRSRAFQREIRSFPAAICSIVSDGIATGKLASLSALEQLKR
jgi:hypothetical protein